MMDFQTIWNFQYYSSSPYASPYAFPSLSKSTLQLFWCRVYEAEENDGQKQRADQISNCRQNRYRVIIRIDFAFPQPIYELFGQIEERNHLCEIEKAD